MKGAVIYSRVSTAKQADEGVSLAAQTSRSRAWAEAMGYEVIGEYQDAGITGSRMDIRDGLRDALAHVTKSGGALVVYSLSRLSRSLRDTIGIGERLNKSGADLVSLSESIDTTSASGKMAFHIMGAFNQFLRDQISENTRNALAHKRSKGERISGRIPFGFDLGDDGKLIENADEQEAITLIHSLRAKGHALRSICEELTSREVKTKTGGKWTPSTVNGILKRVA